MDCSAVRDLATTAQTVICIANPPDWRVYISPALVLLSAGIAYRAIVNQRRLARQRATLDFIEKVESGEHYRNIVAAFSDLRRGVGFSALSNPKTKEQKAQRRCVNDYLNHYEMVAIGIKEGILDDQIYRDWMRGPFVRDWNAAAEFIQRERWKRQVDGTWEYYEKVFENYGLLAARWSHEAILLDESFRAPPSDDAAGGPSDDPIPADNPDTDPGGDG